MAEDEIENGTAPNKRPTWMRFADILLRTAHIGVAGTLLGGFVLQVPFIKLHIWHGLTAATGIGLLALEIRHSRNWPHQGRGVLGILHIGLPGVIHIWPVLAAPLSWTTLVVGSIGSHMPRKLRHWSFIYKKEVD